MVSHNTHKRMVSCLQGHIGADAEKRHVRGKNMPIIAAVSQLSTVSGCVTSPTQVQSHCFETSTLTFSDLSFFFFLPPAPPKTRTTVRTTPLYRKWSGKKTPNPRHSTSLILGTACSISHSDIYCLHSRCMTLLPLGFSLQKQDVQNFYKFSPHRCGESR